MSTLIFTWVYFETTKKTISLTGWEVKLEFVNSRAIGWFVIVSYGTLLLAFLVELATFKTQNYELLFNLGIVGYIFVGSACMISILFLLVSLFKIKKFIAEIEVGKRIVD
jgi:hypothetical protein